MFPLIFATRLTLFLFKLSCQFFGKISLGINQFDCQEIDCQFCGSRVDSSQVLLLSRIELSTLLPFTVPTLVFTPLNVVTWFVFEIYPRAMNA